MKSHPPKKRTNTINEITEANTLYNIFAYADVKTQEL